MIKISASSPRVNSLPFQVVLISLHGVRLSFSCSSLDQSLSVIKCFGASPLRSVLLKKHSSFIVAGVA